MLLILLQDNGILLAVNKFLKLLLSIIICETAGLIGSFFTINSVNTWYSTLNKPFFNPPSWIFGPVWTILYLLMGISLYLVWENKKVNLKWFWIQLILNSFWSILFFGLRNPAIAFFEIIFLWVAIFMTIKSFWNYSKTASWLLLPYLLWVTFASVLNLSVALLNR